jgi:hypothetical protein
MQVATNRYDTVLKLVQPSAFPHGQLAASFNRSASFAPRHPDSGTLPLGGPEQKYEKCGSAPAQNQSETIR